MAGGMAMGQMDLPISPPRFVFGHQGSPSGMLPPIAPESASGKNKRGLTVHIPSGQGQQGGKNKMSPPPSFGLDGAGSAFLTSPGGQAFPSPTAFLSELQTPTNGEGSLDGMTPGALAQFSWNSPQVRESGAASLIADAAAQAEGAVGDVEEGVEPAAKRTKTE
jgi:hypothetical protein